MKKSRFSERYHRRAYALFFLLQVGIFNRKENTRLLGVFWLPNSALNGFTREQAFHHPFDLNALSKNLGRSLSYTDWYSDNI